MKFTSWGAAGEVTGSQHLIETKTRRLLLDCGLFQGQRAESREKNESFACGPQNLDALILSHAHIDHCGNLPGLFKAGFRGPIFCTPATADVAAVMLNDSVRIQAEDARYIRKKLGPDHPRVAPLYEQEHVDRVVKLFETIPYGQTERLGKDVELRFSDAGHILGSAICELELVDGDDKKRVVFTGDLGRRGLPLLRDPQQVPGCDVLITESTYGDRVHPVVEEQVDQLARIIDQTAKRNGRLIIPAFSLGRTQNLVYFLNTLANEGRLPQIQVFVDSPLSLELTRTYQRHQEILDAEYQRTLRSDSNPFAFPGLTFVRSQQESMDLNRRAGATVIIASSGMCESGRVVHHLKHGLGDENNTVLLIGFQGQHTLGRRISERPRTVRIFDRDVPLRADVVQLSGFSAHADSQDFQWWFAGLAKERGVGQAFIVHGEEQGARGVAALLHDTCDEDPVIAVRGKTYVVE